MGSLSDPEFKQQGTDLPKGSATALEEGLDVAEDATSAGGATEDGFADFTDEPDEYDGFAFEETAFPERPLTHGVPFGPGADSVAIPGRDEDTLLNDMAVEMIRTSGTPESVRMWAARRLAGE